VSHTTRSRSEGAERLHEPCNGGSTALLCMSRSTTRSLSRRLERLLAPHVGSVQTSDDPEDVTAPSISLLLNGWGTLQPFAALRECQLKFATPVISIVDRWSGSMILDLLRAGATDCVRWPAALANAELIARVRTRLMTTRQNIKLDAASLTLTCCDVNARLTLVEFRLMHHLLQNAARWSTTEELTIDALRSGQASESVVRVRVYAIRRKLKQQAWRLRSDRKFGYRFDIDSSRPAALDDFSHSSR